MFDRGALSTCGKQKAGLRWLRQRVFLGGDAESWRDMFRQPWRGENEIMMPVRLV